MTTCQKNLKRPKIARRLFLLFLCWNFITPLAVFGAEETPENLKINLDDSGDTISMSFDGALLKDVLLLFSQQSGLNFIASTDVESKKVTVYFENVSPQDALDSIVTANGLAYSKKPGSEIYIVTSASKAGSSEPLITKVIRLKYMRLSDSPLDVGGAVTIQNLKESSQISSTSTAGLVCRRCVTSCALASTSTVGKLASITSLTGASSR